MASDDALIHSSSVGINQRRFECNIIFHSTLSLSYFRKFAATRDNMVQVFHAPGKTKEFNPFVLYRTFYGAYDETVCIDWTTDSRYIMLKCSL